MANINIVLFKWVNGFAEKYSSVDWVAKAAAKYMPFFLLLCLAVIIFFYKRDRIKILFISLSSLSFAMVAVFIIRFLYSKPRPFDLGLGRQLIFHPSGSSFPSGHAAVMFSISLPLLVEKKTRLFGILFFLFTLLGGFARVYCGVHFPFDIVGSFVISIISSIAAVYLFNFVKIRWKKIKK